MAGNGRGTPAIAADSATDSAADSATDSATDAAIAAAPLTVAAVARRLGVAPATLRTWDRRYGLGPSGHTAGSHRRYTPVDVARLEVMRRLTLDGVAPVDAARAAQEVDPGGLARVSLFPTPAADPDDPSSGEPAGDSQVVPLSPPMAVRGLLRAAAALDSQAITRLVTESVHRRGVVWTWDRLLVPVLVGVGTKWQSSGKGVEVEHVLSASIIAALADSVDQPSAPVNHRRVLLSAAEEEQHVLPLHALAAALAERHVASQFLGARMPAAALAQVVRRAGPAVVFVWSQLPSTGKAAFLALLPDQRPAAVVVAGGPGWQEPMPVGVHRSRDLAEAVALIVRAGSA